MFNTPWTTLLIKKARLIVFQANMGCNSKDCFERILVYLKRKSSLLRFQYNSEIL